MKIENRGTVSLIYMESIEELEYVRYNVDFKPWQWNGTKLVVESRFAQDILDGFENRNA